MKANELSCKDLMVGDWVKPKNVDVSFRVGLIGADSVWNDTDTHEWYYDELEPIPLTAEILEKNGFKLDKEDGWWWLTPKIGITFWEEGDIELEFENKHSSVDIHIKYLHQLQQALRLCNVSKEIEL